MVPTEGMLASNACALTRQGSGRVGAGGVVRNRTKMFAGGHTALWSQVPWGDQMSARTSESTEAMRQAHPGKSGMPNLLHGAHLYRHGRNDADTPHILPELVGVDFQPFASIVHGCAHPLGHLGAGGFPVERNGNISSKGTM